MIIVTTAFILSFVNVFTAVNTIVCGWLKKLVCYIQDHAYNTEKTFLQDLLEILKRPL